MPWIIRVFTEDDHSPDVATVDSFQEVEVRINNIIKGGVGHQRGNTYEFWPPNRIIRVSAREKKSE